MSLLSGNLYPIEVRHISNQMHGNYNDHLICDKSDKVLGDITVQMKNI